MPDDLVQPNRLRGLATYYDRPDQNPTAEALRAAAGTIEALEARNRALEEALRKVQAAETFAQVLAIVREALPDGQ